MSDDFVKLVSQSNPAVSRQQYPPQYDGYGHGGQHASTSAGPQQLDPFFDDDDDAHAIPDSAFGPGMPMAMQSTESGFPLAKGAIAPAGTTLNDDTAKAKTWTFDDDEPGSLPYAGASAFPGAPTPTEGANGKVKGRKRWKWPWEKEQELAGERVIALNNSQANVEYINNYVSTSKYNMATFLPKFLFGAENGSS